MLKVIKFRRSYFNYFCVGAEMLLSSRDMRGKIVESRDRTMSGTWFSLSSKCLLMSRSDDFDGIYTECRGPMQFDSD